MKPIGLRVGLRVRVRVGVRVKVDYKNKLPSPKKEIEGYGRVGPAKPEPAEILTFFEGPLVLMGGHKPTIV